METSFLQYNNNNNRSVVEFYVKREFNLFLKTVYIIWESREYWTKVPANSSVFSSASILVIYVQNKIFS